MSYNATVDLRTADITRSVQASIASGLEGIIKPLLEQKQYAGDSDRDIMGLRQQITANVNMLNMNGNMQIKPAPVHIITLDNGKEIVALLFVGSAHPTRLSKGASTTVGALQNLLKYTSQQLAARYLATPTKTSSSKANSKTPASGNKYITTPRKVAPVNPAFVATTRPQQPKVITPAKPKSNHTRMSSAYFLAWDSNAIRNASFDSEDTATPSPDSIDSGYGGATLARSFGSNADTRSGSTTVVDAGDHTYVNVDMQHSGGVVDINPALF
ncbi:uncharacterized protein LTR77_002734 [Saxophila tyrrhenica]|uniref:Uncharacterized protein n=1 Tax=Saxophila tyrrhenica TaxID=1690608 RepID=A0AAV9PFU4_9PEZI|nr:hypothetical protein LTR77_002734 [Saxophila tyrrhenica]